MSSSPNKQSRGDLVPNFLLLCGKGHTKEVARLLAADGGLSYQKHPQSRQSGFTIACLRGNEEIFALLLKALREEDQLKAVLDVVDVSGSTPLLNAVHACNLKITRSLLELGADVTLKATNRRNVAHVACTKKDGLRLLRLFHRKKVLRPMLVEPDLWGATPMQVADSKRHGEQVEFIDLVLRSREEDDDMFFVRYGDDDDDPESSDDDDDSVPRRPQILLPRYANGSESRFPNLTQAIMQQHRSGGHQRGVGEYNEEVTALQRRSSAAALVDERTWRGTTASTGAAKRGMTTISFEANHVPAKNTPGKTILQVGIINAEQSSSKQHEDSPRPPRPVSPASKKVSVIELAPGTANEAANEGLAVVAQKAPEQAQAGNHNSTAQPPAVGPVASDTGISGTEQQDAAHSEADSEMRTGAVSQSRQQKVHYVQLFAGETEVKANGEEDLDYWPSPEVPPLALGPPVKKNPGRTRSPGVTTTMKQGYDEAGGQHILFQLHQGGTDHDGGEDPSPRNRPSSSSGKRTFVQQSGSKTRSKRNGTSGLDSNTSKHAKEHSHQHGGAGKLTADVQQQMEMLDREHRKLGTRGGGKLQYTRRSEQSSAPARGAFGAAHGVEDLARDAAPAERGVSRERDSSNTFSHRKWRGSSTGKERGEAGLMGEKGGENNLGAGCINQKILLPAPKKSSLLLARAKSATSLREARLLKSTQQQQQQYSTKNLPPGTSASGRFIRFMEKNNPLMDMELSIENLPRRGNEPTFIRSFPDDLGDHLSPADNFHGLQTPGVPATSPAADDGSSTRKPGDTAGQNQAGYVSKPVLSHSQSPRPAMGLSASPKQDNVSGSPKVASVARERAAFLKVEGTSVAGEKGQRGRSRSTTTSPDDVEAVSKARPNGPPRDDGKTASANYEKSAGTEPSSANGDGKSAAVSSSGPKETESPGDSSPSGRPSGSPSPGKDGGSNKDSVIAYKHAADATAVEPGSDPLRESESKHANGQTVAGAGRRAANKLKGEMNTAASGVVVSPLDMNSFIMEQEAPALSRAPSASRSRAKAGGGTANSAVSPDAARGVVNAFAVGLVGVEHGDGNGRQKPDSLGEASGGRVTALVVDTGGDCAVDREVSPLHLVHSPLGITENHALRFRSAPSRFPGRPEEFDAARAFEGASGCAKVGRPMRGRLRPGAAQAPLSPRNNQQGATSESSSRPVSTSATLHLPRVYKTVISGAPVAAVEVSPRDDEAGEEPSIVPRRQHSSGSRSRSRSPKPKHCSETQNSTSIEGKKASGKKHKEKSLKKQLHLVASYRGKDYQELTSPGKPTASGNADEPSVIEDVLFEEEEASRVQAFMNKLQDKCNDRGAKKLRGSSSASGAGPQYNKNSTALTDESEYMDSRRLSMMRKRAMHVAALTPEGVGLDPLRRRRPRTAGTGGINYTFGADVLGLPSPVAQTPTAPLMVRVQYPGDSGIGRNFGHPPQIKTAYVTLGKNWVAPLDAAGAQQQQQHARGQATGEHMLVAPAPAESVKGAGFLMAKRKTLEFPSGSPQDGGPLGETETELEQLQLGHGTRNYRPKSASSVAVRTFARGNAPKKNIAYTGNAAAVARALRPLMATRRLEAPQLDERDQLPSFAEMFGPQCTGQEGENTQQMADAMQLGLLQEVRAEQNSGTLFDVLYGPGAKEFLVAETAQDVL
ncbi:unnamed protein product [Amoebophrya sp. A25]|nr:unnamed protein product [Amoebophrya sp. A25]|eukprot:GSA25T00002333001.1